MEYIHYKRHYLFAGDLFVTIEPYMISTVLSSCVTTCLWDKNHRIGGMNHFVLPKNILGKESSSKYGDTAVRSLLDKMLGMGCRRENLRARVFGGACVAKIRPDSFEVGSKNMDMAIKCFAEEGVSLIGGDGNSGFACKLTFNTHYGSVRVEDIYSSDKGLPTIKEAWCPPDSSGMLSRNIKQRPR